jgi:regulator of protease activity HflC (stomatin/prohibitin superfamily)
MKNLLFILSAIVLLFSTQSCSLQGIDSGSEGVMVMKPYIFGSGGISNTPLEAGRHTIAISTDVIVYDIKPVKFTEDFDDVITNDNNPVDFTAFITLKINEGESPKLHKSFGTKWYSNNVEEQFRAKLRGYCSQFKMFTLTTDRSVLDSLEVTIKNEMQKYITELEMPVKVIEITIGKVTPPREVLAETTKTAAEKQAIKTQEAREDKENARRNADRAKALADMEYKNTFTGMSVDQYLHLRALEIEKEKIEMVKGKQNVSIIMSSGGSIDAVKTIK